jgi:hypothetical protein
MMLVERLLSKHEALSSNNSAAKKKLKFHLKKKSNDATDHRLNSLNL